MQRKLTLRLEETLITKAKRYSLARGKSLSELVAAFFDSLQENVGPEESQISPRISFLKGALLRGVDRKLGKEKKN